MVLSTASILGAVGLSAVAAYRGVHGCCNRILPTASAGSPVGTDGLSALERGGMVRWAPQLDKGHWWCLSSVF